MEIPLATFADASLTSGVGEDTRVSDHATVAMNSNRDVLVAFHSHRADLGPPPLGTDPLGIPELKQVEVAFFEYRGDETWGWRETLLVGSVDYSPVQLLTGIPTVSCERPDIIADGERFFVSWTRQYHKDSPGATFEPAVLECAWIQIVPGSPDSTMEITGHEPLLGVTPQPGRGFELDIHVPTISDFFGRECKVTPDAVVLIDPTDEFKVAVAYSHQTDFAGTTPGDTTRSCEVRMVTCTFDPNATGYPITHVASFPALQQNVQFDGVNPSTGFILPDLAPSGEENAFWMVTEAQEVSPPPASLNNGAIRLGYWKLQSGNWVNQASRTYSSPPSDPYLRRRPMISAYPEGTGEQVVAVTFSKVDNDVQTGDDPSAQVITNTHSYQNGGLSFYPMPASGTPYFLDYPKEALIYSGEWSRGWKSVGSRREAQAVA